MDQVEAVTKRRFVCRNLAATCAGFGTPQGLDEPDTPGGVRYLPAMSGTRSGHCQSAHYESFIVVVIVLLSHSYGVTYEFD
jgi:hypothetical protein